jgi:hypothetical protein
VQPKSHARRERAQNKKQTKTKKQNELKIRKAEVKKAGKLKCRINKGQRQAYHAVKRERAHNDTTGENNIASHRIAASKHARTSFGASSEACVSCVLRGGLYSLSHSDDSTTETLEHAIARPAAHGGRSIGCVHGKMMPAATGIMIVL